MGGGINVVNWVEIIKSLLSDGESTLGFTVWNILIFITALAFIVYYVGKYRSAFGRGRLSRIFLSGVSLGRRVRFKVYGDKFSDVVLMNGIKKGIADGLTDFDVELYELDER
jgi:hypothetical protein